MSYLDSPLAHRIGWTLVHTVWQDLIIAILFAMALLSLRRAAPNARYLAASVALAAIAIAPVVTFMVLPSVSVSLEGPQADLAKGFPLAQVSLPTAASGWGGILSMLEPMTPQIVGMWLLGLALMGMRLLGGLLLVERSRRLATAAPEGEWQGRLNDLAIRLGIKRPVRLMLTHAGDIPSAIGFMRLAVLLPASALSKLTPDQIEALLAHELAHIRRHDYLVNLLQSVLEMTQFYHPAVWWISNVMRTERENCCDDLAVQALGDAVGYARALASLEALRVLSPQLAMTANGGSLMQRIKRILGGPGRATRGGFAWLPCLAAAALVVPFGAYAQTQKKKAITEKSEVLVESQEPLGASLRESLSKVLDDPNAEITIDGKSKKVKDLDASERIDLKRRFDTAAKRAHEAMLDSRRAVRFQSTPMVNGPWDWADDEAKLAKRSAEATGVPGEMARKIAVRQGSADEERAQKLAAEAAQRGEGVQADSVTARELAMKASGDARRAGQDKVLAEEDARNAQTFAKHAVALEQLAQMQAASWKIMQDADSKLSAEQREDLQKQLGELRQQMQEMREQMRKQFAEGTRTLKLQGEFKVLDGAKLTRDFQKNFDEKKFAEDMKLHFDQRKLLFEMKDLQRSGDLDRKKFAEDMVKQSKDWQKMSESLRKSGQKWSLNIAPPGDSFDFPMPPEPPEPLSETLRMDGDQITVRKLTKGGYEIRIWNKGKAKVFKVRKVNYRAKGKGRTSLRTGVDSPGERNTLILPDGRKISFTSRHSGSPVLRFSASSPVRIPSPKVKVLTITGVANPSPVVMPDPEVGVAPATPTPPVPPSPSIEPPSPRLSEAAVNPRTELAMGKILSLPTLGRLI